MSTTIVFEAATLNDALSKASRVAPTKGSAWDKAAGFVMEIDPALPGMVLKATDTESTYRQQVPAVSGSGDGALWRIPSTLFGGIVGGLPMGDNQVTLIDRGDSFLRLTCGKMVAKLAMIDSTDYPIIPVFDVENLSPAHDLAAKCEQVAWSCDRNSKGPLGGIRIDGKRLIGTSQQTVAMIPCEAPVVEPVTVPLISIAQLLKAGSDVRLGAVEGRLHVALDAETQVTATILEGSYPDIDNPNVSRTNFTGSAKVHKQSFVEALDRMMALIRMDRAPVLRMEFNGEGLIKVITFDMEVPDQGRMQDGLDVAGEFEGIFNIHFNPTFLVNAVRSSRADFVTMEWGHPDAAVAHLRSVRVSDDKDYQCYIMPVNK